MLAWGNCTDTLTMNMLTPTMLLNMPDYLSATYQIGR